MTKQSKLVGGAIDVASSRHSVHAGKLALGKPGGDMLLNAVQAGAHSPEHKNRFLDAPEIGKVISTADLMLILSAENGPAIECHRLES